MPDIHFGSGKITDYARHAVEFGRPIEAENADIENPANEQGPVENSNPVVKDRNESETSSWIWSLADPL